MGDNAGAAGLSVPWLLWRQSIKSTQAKKSTWPNSSLLIATLQANLDAPVDPPHLVSNGWRAMLLAQQTLTHTGRPMAHASLAIQLVFPLVVSAWWGQLNLHSNQPWVAAPHQCL